MKKIGRKVYYDKLTGEVIKDTGEKVGKVTQTTIEQDITAFTALSERNRDTFDVIELEYGEYSQDFQEGRLIGVNLETKTPIFEYPNPENPSEPIVVEKPLSTEIEELKQENTLLKAQNQALTDRTDFHEEVLTEIIVTINS